MTFNKKDNLANIHSSLIQTKRCVLPIRGFYEWENKIELGKPKKVPYFIYDKDEKNKFLFLGGIYEEIDFQGKGMK